MLREVVHLDDRTADAASSSFSLRSRLKHSTSYPTGGCEGVARPATGQPSTQHRLKRPVGAAGSRDRGDAMRMHPFAGCSYPARSAPRPASIFVARPLPACAGVDAEYLHELSAFGRTSEARGRRRRRSNRGLQAASWVRLRRRTSRQAVGDNESWRAPSGDSNPMDALAATPPATRPSRGSQWA